MCASVCLPSSLPLKQGTWAGRCRRELSVFLCASVPTGQGCRGCRCSLCGEQRGVQNSCPCFHKLQLHFFSMSEGDIYFTLLFKHSVPFSRVTSPQHSGLHRRSLPETDARPCPLPQVHCPSCAPEGVVHVQEGRCGAEEKSHLHLPSENLPRASCQLGH